MVNCRLALNRMLVAGVLCVPTIVHTQEADGPGTMVDETPLQSQADVPRVETSMIGLDDAWTTGASLSELEITLVYSQALRAFRNDGSTEGRGANDVVAGVVTFSHGLTRRVDVTASTFGVSYHDEDEIGDRGGGVGDLFLDFKWHFSGNGVDGLQLAYRPGLSIPIGSENEASAQAPGLGYWTINQALIATLLKQRWVAGFETGFLLPIGDRDDARGLGFGSVGVGYQVTARVKPQFELNYLRDFFDDNADSEILAATAGLIIHATDSFRLDLGLRRGIRGKNTDERLTGTVNLSFSFGSP